MPLTADLAVRLDASTLVEGFVTQISQSSGSFNAIPNPVDAAQLQSATSAGGAFAAGPILAAVNRFASVTLPDLQAPATLQRIETTLASIEGLTTGNLVGDISAQAQQLSSLLDNGSTQGVPGILLQVLDVLRGSPTTAALGPILSQLASGLPLPGGLGDALPAVASTVRALAGLMVYETVLAEGERLTGIVESLFSADAAHTRAVAIQTALHFGDGSLAQALAAADPSDDARVAGLVAAVENAAAQLDELDAYVSRGLGFGEATLVHFDVQAAQAEIGAAGALLRDPDLGALRRLLQSVAQQAGPFIELLDPGDVAARGMEDVLQLAEGQVDQAAAAIRALDASALVTPLTAGLTSVMQPLRDFSNLVAQVVAELRAVLRQMQDAVAALPIDDIAGAIRSALAPVTEALQFVQRLVDDIRAALETAAQTALVALNGVEGTVDDFQHQIEALFEQARDFVDGLHLDQVVASISDEVGTFVGLLQQAQMKPYFDTASAAIDTAADVMDQVPLELLPESMKADLDAALAPVREVDPDAVESQIESLLQIGPDGEFQLRGDLEAALATIQDRFDALLAMLDQHHPSIYLDQLDAQLGTLADRIQQLSPQLTLEPVQQAIAQVKAALGSFDLASVLQPVQSVFDRAIAALDEFSPAQLLQPLAQRVVQARQALEDAIRIAQWRPALDGLAATGLAQLQLLDPTALATLLRAQLDALQMELDNLPDISPGKWLGVLVAGLMRGSALRIAASSIDSVMRWVGGAPASAELTARATRIADAITGTRREVDGFDPTSLSATVPLADAARVAALALAARLTNGSESRLRLQASANRLQVSAVVGGLAANRARYQGLLQSAAGLGDALRRTGMSEADVAADQLRQACSPLAPLLEKMRELATFLGVRGTQSGFAAVLRSVLSVATPARLSGLAVKLVAALRDRLLTLVDQVLAPVRSGIDDVQHLLDLLDLQPLIDSVQGIFQEVKNQLLAYSPSVLLADPLAAFAALKQELAAFDPLASILTVLDALRDTAARVVGKLSAHKLLEAPLAIYDTILNAIRQLDLSTLIAPVLDTLDTIALQVDQGLDETVGAFKHLQDSLPAPGGGSSVSVSVGVG